MQNHAKEDTIHTVMKKKMREKKQGGSQVSSHFQHWTKSTQPKIEPLIINNHISVEKEMTIVF